MPADVPVDVRTPLLLAILARQSVAALRLLPGPTGSASCELLKGAT